MKIEFNKEECINTEAALRKEWIDTNGNGGYASSTILNCHTRKYHGILTAALNDPPGRYVLLSKVEPALVSERERFHLSTNKYPGVFHPTGHKYIEKFRNEFYPEIFYRIGDIVLKKSIIMIEGENTVMLHYTLLESKPALRLRLRPLLAYRSIHALQHKNMAIQVKTYFKEHGFKIQPYDGMPPLYLYTNLKSEFYPGPDWHQDVEYLKERRRGYPYQEDLFSPGLFELELRKGHDVILAVSTGPQQPRNLTKKRNQEIKRRKAVYAELKDENEHLQNLKYAARQLIIVTPQDEASVLAGYHWFDAWGRDALIALPGLAFCSGRLKEGAEVLDTFASRETQGLLPNYINAQGGEDAYNSIDAGLWFFWTVQQFLKYGGQAGKVKSDFFPAMNRMLYALLDGTNPLLRLREDGLVEAGDEDTQLTWMDAQAFGRPVTPRHGCAVEINALWYNALRFWMELCDTYGQVHDCFELAERAAASFRSRFWNEADECLFDVVRDDWCDPAIRPNQVMAVSLPWSPLNPDQARAVTARMRSELLTPFGLRTLSPRHPAYKHVYEGDQDQRDAAYHQGTVWPWLAGHFGEAWLKTAADPQQARAFLEQELQPLLTAFPRDFGTSSIPEIFSGSPPHKPKGCIHQAWSIAEVIRLICLLKEV